MKTRISFLTLFAFALSIGATSMGQTSKGYKVVDKIKIGGEGGWDYLLADAAAHRLYVSHGTRVVVVDTKANTAVGEIPNTNGVHGIALVPDLGRGYTSNGRDSSVTVFDLGTLKTITTIQLNASNPDAIIYDPFSHRVFTFNGRSHNTTAIDPNSNSIVGTLDLDGKPEFAVADGHGKIFVNLEDKSMIAVFESKSLKVLDRWSIAPGEEPSGLAFDRAHNRLFSVCGNEMMIVVDATSGKVVTSLPIGAGVDAAAYDPTMHLAFASNGEGTLTVVREETPEKFSVVENVATQRSCRTMALDEETHRVYLSGATFGPTPAPTAEHPRPRPTIEPGSFVVLILDRQ
jgi:DNA-binding beta-propeller fold protein YncE